MKLFLLACIVAVCLANYALPPRPRSIRMKDGAADASLARPSAAYVEAAQENKRRINRFSRWWDEVGSRWIRQAFGNIRNRWNSVSRWGRDTWNNFRGSRSAPREESRYAPQEESRYAPRPRPSWRRRDY